MTDSQSAPFFIATIAPGGQQFDAWPEQPLLQSLLSYLLRSRNSEGDRIGTPFQGLRTSKSASLLINTSASHASSSARN